MSTPGQAVLERVAEHRRIALEMEPYAPDHARLMLELATEYETDVLEHVPEWWRLSAVQVATGWARATLRRKCQRLEAEGKARQEKNGRWLMRHDVVLDLPKKPVATTDIDPGDDLDATAEMLASEV